MRQDPLQEHEQMDTTTTMIQEDVIPESLMALAKDARYMEDVKRILIQILGQKWWWRWTTTREGDDNDSSSRSNNNNNNHEITEMNAWYVSVILYALLVVTKRGKTLGMEATGLQYYYLPTRPQGTTIPSLSRRVVVSWSIVTASLIYALRRITLDRTNSSNNPSLRMDSLRGNRRRLAFEQQRQAMLMRAQEQQQDQSSSSSPTINANAALAHGSGGRRLVGILRQIVQSITKTIMSGSTGGGSGGPHDLLSSQGGEGQSGAANFSIGMWCLRLYLAYYLIDGRYPTWMHRIAGISLTTVQEKESCALSTSSGTTAAASPSPQHPKAAVGLVHRPESMRLVGLLMLVHASGIMTQQFSNAFIKWWIDRNPPNINNSSLTSRLKFDWSGSRGEMKNVTLTDNGGSSSSLSRTATSTTTTTLCAICQEHRKFPACPVACGHVFCWNCLQQGLMNRPECPVCRAACRPQDVLPLYDYEPPAAAARSEATAVL